MSQLGSKYVLTQHLQPPGPLEHGSFQEQTRGEVFQNLVFNQEWPFRGAQNTQPSVCTSKRGRPSQALRVARSSLCQQGKEKQPSCLANLTRGFSNQLGLEEGGSGGREGAASSACIVLQTLESSGLSWCSQESPGNSPRTVMSAAPHYWSNLDKIWTKLVTPLSPLSGRED